LAVGGFVKNLPDGRVQLEAEGERSEVETLLQRVRQAMQGHVRAERIDWQPPRGEEGDFRVAT
jgi:acylphosphatase